LLKKVSDPAKLPVLTRSANRESISYGDSYGAGGGAERFFAKLLNHHLAVRQHYRLLTDAVAAGNGRGLGAIPPIRRVG
jgi:hypothetical protein